MKMQYWHGKHDDRTKNSESPNKTLQHSFWIDQAVKDLTFAQNDPEPAQRFERPWS